MRNLMFGLLAALVLGSGAAFAQNGFYAGASAGYPGAALHFGVEDVGAAGLDARLNIGYAYDGDFSFGVDALYGLNVDTDDLPIDVYVGGGVGADFGGSFFLKGLVGAEYRLVEIDVPALGVFVEVGPTFDFDGGVGADARLGVNYHF